jgi:uncharacterized protein YdeI (YjbR/CyaY-like superfamily)
MKPIHFQTAEEFRHWLEQNHDHAAELWIAFYKKGAAKKGMMYAEAVDEALCFGWIDGIIKRLDAQRFMHRFTPRKSVSTWSNLNIQRVERLMADGKMRPPGIAAFKARRASRTGIYGFESAHAPALASAFERQFRANAKAWSFFTAQPPGYQRLAIHRVMAPKQEVTRQRWLQRLIAESAAGKRLDPMVNSAKRRAAQSRDEMA